MTVVVTGFGRIGRAVTRMLLTAGHPVLAHDTVEDEQLLRYLLAHDSVYGAYTPPDASLLTLRTGVGLEEVLDDSDARLVVDATPAAFGRDYLWLVKQHDLDQVVVTHMIDGADFTWVEGVTGNAFLAPQHRVISAGTCDVVAIAPVIAAVHRCVPVEAVSVVTLHPWLGDQQLLDGARGATSEYAMSRAAPGNLIPRETTAIAGLQQVLPWLVDRVNGFCFRVPTASVSSAVLTLELGAAADALRLRDQLTAATSGSQVVALNSEPLVSCDFRGHDASAIVDLASIRQVGARSVQLRLWYDNEWGYARHVTRILDRVRPSAARSPLPTDLRPDRGRISTSPEGR